MEPQQLETEGYKYCRQCRKEVPASEFINRDRTGYCIVCKTCRDRQLKRYYERRDELERYPYKDSKLSEKKETSITNNDPDRVSNTHYSESINSKILVPHPYENGLTVSGRAIISFLQAHCRVISNTSTLKETDSVCKAKVLYHRTFSGN